MIEGNSVNFEAEVFKSEKLVLVDFNADWCGPCQMMKPIVEKLASSNDKVKFVSVNVDDESELSETYGVVTIPCFVVFKDGKEVAREIGVISPKKLAKMLEV